MAQVKAKKIPRPKVEITEFESKLIDLLFKATRTDELPVERLFEVAKQIAPEILKNIPKWKHGTPPRKGWWLTKTERRNGEVLIACEPWKDDEWPYEYENNVLYMDMNDLENLHNED